MSVEKGLDDQNQNMIKGILGQIMEESSSDKQSLLDDATRNATDLSAFVKRKPADSKTSQANISLKRSVDEEVNGGKAKKSRTGDANENPT